MTKIITGDTATMTFSILNPGAVDSVPTPDLSTATIDFAMAYKNKIVVRKSIVHPDTNILTFTMTPQETSILVPGAYNACCKIYYDAGEEKTVWMGDIMVIKGVLDA